MKLDPSWGGNTFHQPVPGRVCVIFCYIRQLLQTGYYGDSFCPFVSTKLVRLLISKYQSLLPSAPFFYESSWSPHPCMFWLVNCPFFLFSSALPFRVEPCLGPQPGDIRSSDGTRAKGQLDWGQTEARLDSMKASFSPAPKVPCAEPGEELDSVRTYQPLRGKPALLLASFKLSLSKAEVILLFIYYYYCFFP